MTKPLFSSTLAPILNRYVDMKRSLGRGFVSAIHTLQSLDRFLREQPNGNTDLNPAVFQGWCRAQTHVASGVRRARMLEIYKFCAYRRRMEPRCFLPDTTAFPPYHQGIKPYIFSQAEAAQLFQAAASLSPSSSTPLRAEVTRLAIVLLFTTGVRRGELLNLTIGDYDRQEATLLIRRTKFFKSRLLPINAQIADEIERLLQARTRKRLPSPPQTPLIWNAIDGGRLTRAPGWTTDYSRC